MGMVGKKHSIETRAKMSKSHIGKNTWSKGKKPSLETRSKMSKAHSGSKNNNWKGGIGSDNAYYNRIRRNRKLGADGSHTMGEWETLKAQYNWKCPCCGQSEPEIKLTEDHIIPLSKGGSDNIENIQPLCQPCNSKKHTQIVKY